MAEKFIEIALYCKAHQKSELCYAIFDAIRQSKITEEQINNKRETKHTIMDEVYKKQNI